MSPEELLRLHPAFHLDGEGRPISWGIGEELLRFVGERLRDGDRTLETGAGISTVYFTLLGCRHTAITPASRELDLIREFCREHEIPTDRLELVPERSEWALPVRLPQWTAAGESLDLVLVDGRHAFPSPFIDWFYGAAAMRVGGWMVVDDTQLLTGRQLRDFMAADPHWRSVTEIGKSAVFEKLDAAIHEPEWDGQPYLLGGAGPTAPGV